MKNGASPTIKIAPRLLVGLLAASTVVGCRPRADAFTKIEHPAINDKVEANEVKWNDGEAFGLPGDVYKNVASLTEMTQDEVCFDIVLSGFDDEAVGDLSRAGFVLLVGDQRFTPNVQQIVEPQVSEHKGKRTEWETVDTGLRESVCVDGIKDDQGKYISCNKWQENKITETRSYDVPQMYKVVQGAGKACFDTKGKIKPEEVEHLLLQITNAKSERTSAFWGVKYQAMTRLRWDMIGDLPEKVAAKWGGFGGTPVAGDAIKKAEPEEVAEKEPEPEPEDTSAVEPSGIKACDDYVQKMMTCAENMPEASGKPMRASAKQLAQSYKQMAGNKNSKSAAEQGCKQGAIALKSNPSCKAPSAKKGKS